MKRALLMMALALVAILPAQPLCAAEVPVPAPIIEELPDPEGMTLEEMLDALIEGMNLAAQDEGANQRMFKDDARNTVVMQFDASDLGIDMSEMTPEMTDFLKSYFLSNVVEESDDFAEMVLLAAGTDRNFECRLVNGFDETDAVSFIYTPAEVMGAVNVIADSDEDEDIDSVEDVDPDETDLDALLQELVDDLEKDFASDPELNCHIWLDEQANRVVMAIINEDFTDIADARGTEPLMKSIFLNSLLEEGDFNGFLFVIIASTGRGLQLRLTDPNDTNNPLVLDYTADELMKAFVE